MRPHPRVGLVYDVRNTSATGMDNPSLYAAFMDQVAWLDGRGLDLVWFTEHHFLDDDYLPSWIPVTGAYETCTLFLRRLSSAVQPSGSRGGTPCGAR